MPLPKEYLHPPEQIATFTFTELASGLGFRKFYLTKTEDNSGIQETLQETVLYSSEVDSRRIEIGAKTYTFLSSEFNAPRQVQGIATLNLGARWDLSGTPHTITVTLSKYDGSDTDVISATKTLTIAGQGRTVLAFELPCTQTLIKIGEQLKLVIVSTVGSGSGTWIAIGHDPQNRDGTWLTPTSDDTITSSNINVPFRVDN